MKKSNKNNLRNKLISSFLVISLVPNIILFTILLSISLTSSAKDIYEEANSHASQIASDIETLLESKQALLNNTASAPSIVAIVAGDDVINLTDRQRTVTFFEKLVDDGAFSYVLLINQNSKYLIDRSDQVWRRNNLTIIDEIKSDLTRYGQTRLIEDLKNQAGVLMSIPINGGSIVAVIPMSEFGTYLEEDQMIAGNSKILVFNQSGDVLYPTAGSGVESLVPIFNETIRAETNAYRWKDAQNNTFLYGFAPLNIVESNFEWKVFQVTDEWTAFQSVRSQGLFDGLVGLILAATIVIGGWIVGTNVSKPIAKLADVTERMAAGNLKVYIPDESKITEIKSLREAVQKLQNSLLFQITSINEMASQISSSVILISGSIAQLASNSAETTSSITEISATVEETRETSSISASKAQSVALNSENVLEIADEGQTATTKAVDGMQSIREEMDSLANRISLLSEQTQSIASIITTVEAVAEQSNLLAVNAAIEAAKAGDAGAGFAVVAQEVKSLAEQSKTATVRVRSILEDIRKATSAAVLAAERSGKAVEAGAQRTSQVGEVIAQLAQGLSESADTSMQIALSNQEQLTGMNQLVLAIEAIQAASSQNMDATRQIENAIRALSDLATNLTQIVSEFDL